MEAFVSRKRRRLSPPPNTLSEDLAAEGPEEDSTELKLALLSSLHPDVEQQLLLDILLVSEGSVEQASKALSSGGKGLHIRKKTASALGYQSSLTSFATQESSSPSTNKQLTRKGKTLNLFSPEDIAAQTPCSIIHNFLAAEEANELLKELLAEAPTFHRQTFKLFDNVVQSPHSACFFVSSLEEVQRQKTEYLYNGSFLTDIREITPQMRLVSAKVQKAVNREVTQRILTHYPGQRKLPHQSPAEWIPNAAFVNCYAGPRESVGYHSDQLTYLGPRATIGSLSLGVAREFRVRRIVPRDSSAAPYADDARANAEGQIALHLPHNSLLVMHAEMQEEWKHSIHPATSVAPHPIAGTARINVTYRCYRADMHPRYTPRCKCKVPCVLRVVQRKQGSAGRYFWACHAGNVPGKEGCSFFEWAVFDEDGRPVWAAERGGGKGAAETRTADESGSVDSKLAADLAPS
ncbi:MAG: hypothetical protein M1829_002662 [Trizodia sp. TS-e1964]|nr:MAG: hypothetical protein M1829_002662 [Trizodia sp. TS-e1964]